MEKIISDALKNFSKKEEYLMNKENNEEDYQIAKSDYQAFMEKYSVKNKNIIDDIHKK